MATKKQRTTAIWRLRIPVDVIADIKKLAAREERSTTKQATVLLREALEARAK